MSLPVGSNHLMAVPMAKPENLVLMAIIGGPHGIRGEVRAKPYGDEPLKLGSYGPLVDDKGRTFKVLAVRPAKNVVVMRLEGVSTREAAAALNGVSLFIDRAQLPDDLLDEDEFFQTDLVGLAVHDAEGSDYGKVLAVHNFGAGDILEIAQPGKASVMIPFSDAAVPEVDMDARTVLVEPIAAGLIDVDNEGSDGDESR